jgi:hypothetical protein
MCFDPTSYSMARVVHDHALSEAAARRRAAIESPHRPVRAVIGSALIRLGEAIGGRRTPADAPAAIPAG